MQSRLVPHILLAFGCAFVMGRVLCAQPPASETPSPTRPPSGDLIRESDLKWRLEDEDGNLVPVPAFTLELFQELLELQSRVKAKPETLPKAIFTRPIELDGSVDAEKQFAQLVATYPFRLPLSVDREEDRWTAISLRLDNAYLDTSAVEHEGEGEIYVARDGAAYVCWLRAAPGSTHSISVPIKIPVRRTGTQDSLSMMLPEMATKLRLTVDAEELEAFSLSERSNLAWTTENGQTVITVESGGGALDLAWQPTSQIVPHALEATCAATVHIHGNRIWSEAQLKVRSRAEPIDSFIVRLPEGMVLTPRTDSDFQISPLPTGGENSAQHVLIKRLSGATRGLIEVSLEAEFPPIKTETQRRTVQLAGFSVQDAVREWGSVDVMLDGNWSTNWTLGQFVQQVAVADTLTKQPAAARFLYDRQPYSLRLELRPKQARGSLEITYLVDVSDEAVQLDAQISYSTNGAPGDALSFRMPGWTDVTVSPPESLVRPFTFDEMTGVLTLPISTDATQYDFRVRARRPLAIDATEVNFQLPRPSDLTLVPDATLIVLAADNVELTPEFAQMKWLMQETRVITEDLPHRFASPLLFREELSPESSESASFVARRRIRPRETSIAVTSDATLNGDMVQVRQSYLMNVAYAPLAELTVAIPAAALESGTLQITSGEQALGYQPIPPPALAAGSPGAEPAPPATAARTLAVVSFPAPVLGEYQLDIEYELPRGRLASAEGLEIPLVQPADDEVTENVTNTLTVKSSENAAVALLDELWAVQSDNPSTANGKNELRIRATEVVGSALVRTSILDSRSSGATQIRRVWIQTWLTPTDRRDRVCFQMLSDQPRLHLELPAVAQQEDLRVLVEGKPPLELVRHGDLSLTITLADEQVGRLIGLEMWYFCDSARDSRLGVSLPTIIDADRAELVYWQIVLPRGEHLAWIPATLTSELVWQRDQFYWGRRGRLEQPALEKLAGASSQQLVSPETNRYLFSSTGSVDSVAFVKVSRLTLMLGASSVVLIAVLPFLYLPLLRQPAVFLVAGLLLAAGAATYPEYTVILGQAGAIGLGLAIVACGLQRLLGRSPAAPITRRGSVYITSDSQVSAGPPRVTEGSSRATTATAPAHLQVARVEGDS